MLVREILALNSDAVRQHFSNHRNVSNLRIARGGCPVTANMKSPARQTEMMLLAQALDELRDSLVHVSMALSDLIADTRRPRGTKSWCKLIAHLHGFRKARGVLP